MEEITEEVWQKIVDIIVPNRRQNPQGPGLIADRQRHSKRLQRNDHNQVVKRVESQVESQRESQEQ